MSIELTRTEDIIGTLGKNKKKNSFMRIFYGNRKYA